MRPNDRELLDVLLGDAPEAVREKVGRAMADPKVSARHSAWSGVLSASRESRSAASLHQAIVEGALTRLRATNLAGERSMCSPQAQIRRAENLRHRWYALGGLAVAGFIVIGMLTHVLTRETAHPTDALEAAAITNGYVDFAAAQRGDGTTESPFSTLQPALQQVASGGTLRIKAGASGETFRLEKKVRIESLNGTVRIGSS